MSSLTRTQIYLEKAQIKALDKRARALGSTRSDVIRDLVNQGLANNNNKPTLYDVVMALGPPADNPSMTQGAFAKRRKKLEAELKKRAERFKAQRRGELD
jgi:hypothetical protein